MLGFLGESGFESLGVVGPPEERADVARGGGEGVASAELFFDPAVPVVDAGVALEVERLDNFAVAWWDIEDKGIFGFLEGFFEQVFGHAVGAHLVVGVARYADFSVAADD